ncbi:hypothetical protein BCR44DRAFT_1512728 [Catenaria anguillulae PL171]|uniref:Uncharacterized protein n=1 Tax=Catenaria anguillulae PL171 TaxID=765915 RepID=A0A1Y2HNU1_9FUNG|nr:hypothetical protein BCR44DRAFT_1512728 [Catenaria anguillulae PL171]
MNEKSHRPSPSRLRPSSIAPTPAHTKAASTHIQHPTSNTMSLSASPLAQPMMGTTSPSTYYTGPDYGKQYPSISSGGLPTSTSSPSGLMPRATATLTNVVPSAWTTIRNTLSSFTEPVWNSVSSTFLWLWDTASSYWYQYPALRAFSFAFGALTAIPVAIFLGYAAVALSVIGGIALVVGGATALGALGFGMLFLGPVLFFSFWGALIGTGLYTALVYGLRASAVTIATAQNATGMQPGTGIVGSTVGVLKNTVAATADMATKVEGLTVGNEGLPVPISGRV